jgi:flagellar biosynthesis protein FlhA
MIFKNTEIIMALLVMCILLLMILPLPAFLLDFLISLNITLALVVILVSIYILKPMDFSAFPSVLLLITLFRLSLNVCSTRMILLKGSEGPQAAGKVIMAFGSFVVGGNYVVGTIVFLILVLINFLVITKGSGRIAEVAARFTLDAMPGKQMSIDADLNAGIISEDDAKHRRQMITKEAEYYGAMDGANKFVKGDAIAGIIITFINIIGGLIIGIFQNDMSFYDAARTYTLLTVGDGLVTQIPALVVATSAGVVVTRAASESSMGKEIISQIFDQPAAIAIAAFILLGFGLIPGLPGLPFIFPGLGAGLLAYILFRSSKDGIPEKEGEAAAAAETESGRESGPLLPVDVLTMEVGYELIPFADSQQGGQLLPRIRMIRDQIAQEIGIIIPPVHIKDNMKLKPGEYVIQLKGNEIAGAELMPDCLLAMHIGSGAEPVKGIPGNEPTYGLPAYWIREEVREDALAKGYTVVDPPTVMITHLSDIIRRHAGELIGRQEVRNMLDSLKNSHPALVDELIPNLLSLGIVCRVLQNLLSEQVPVRDMPGILETLADYAPMSKDPDMLTEYTRQALARTITSQYREPDGNIPLIVMGQTIEQIIGEAVKPREGGNYIALPPDTAQAIVQKIARQIQNFSVLNQKPVVLCSAPIRRHLKKLLDRFIPDITVLSYNELLYTQKIQPLTTVEFSNED